MKIQVQFNENSSSIQWNSSSIQVQFNENSSSIPWKFKFKSMKFNFNSMKIQLPFNWHIQNCFRLITKIRELEDMGALCFRAGKLTSVMADIEPEFDVEKDLPEFLLSVLDRSEECIHDSETDINDLRAQSVVLDRTIRIWIELEFHWIEIELWYWILLQ